ncbi:MerR family transcriptional regulator [Streptomyces purpurogeneiscleroticus]|uniref:MerR family transcriptional regulator n=1 Tax=Streptomyces purpurogeneiscleroticus TaxID=68259 RepID=UPI001CC03D53|nr:MerR family transcriptional regulator [Streptomyces purpurogeneiscleroticus]MBZ4017697.1 transcriptional regulator [Streptomyces purpurogeneiscleroticus]
MTTGDLARRLGVAPTTLRSWDRRYGLGPAVHPEGQHRRWTPQDVAVLEEMCRLTSAGVPPAEAARAAKDWATSASRRDERAQQESALALPASARTVLRPGDVRLECRGLIRAATRLDAPTISRQLTSLVDAHGLVTAWDQVLVPTLHAVGRKWETTSSDRYVEAEHLLSWHVSTALRRVSTPPMTDSTPLLLACVPEEQHTLPLEALNAALSERGLPTRMFGAAVPIDALAAAVRRTGPPAIVLWSQVRGTAGPPLARQVAATRWGVRGARRQPVVLLCGPGWATSAPQTGMRHPLTLHDALMALTQLCEANAAKPADQSAAGH